jgi:hypothetical protein
MNTTPTKPKVSYDAKRKNIYFKNPHLYEALQQAIDKGIIRARSGSHRVEELIANEIRRVAPRMRKAGLTVPTEAFAD